MHTKSLFGLSAATLTLLAIGGCGGSDPSSKPDVANVRGTQPTAVASSRAPERPLIRPDATEQEIHAMEQAYLRCLQQNGVVMNASSTGELGKPKDLYDPHMPAAAKACAPKEPENWLDRERRNNPEFVDRLRDAVKCLKAKGFNARVDGDPPSIHYSNTAEFMRAGDAEAECQRKAFAGRIKQLYQR
jgi:hypothetical protein